jgi:hypothetical protein
MVAQCPCENQTRRQYSPLATNLVVDLDMSDIHEACRIVVIVSSFVILCCVAYWIITWVRNTEQPWNRFVTGCFGLAIALMPLIQFWGIANIGIADCTFLCRQLVHDQLPVDGRNELEKMARIQLLGGLFFLVVGTVGRNLFGGVRKEDLLKDLWHSIVDITYGTWRKGCSFGDGASLASEDCSSYLTILLTTHPS